jgi:DNA gyrase subunit A
MGRNAAGVRGVKLVGNGDHVVGLVCISDASRNLLVVSEKGYGKRSEIEDYRVTNRGTQGVRTLNITDKTGHVVGILDVDDKNELMIINKSGIMIRMTVADLRVMGRNTQGVRLIRLNDDDEISSIARIDIQEEEVQGTEDGASDNPGENSATEIGTDETKE